MTAPAFDPDAIARRVFDTEQAAIQPADLPPLARAEGMTVTGGGDGRGRPVPTQAVGTAEDIFDRLERQRAAHQVQSPFGPPDQRKPVTPPSVVAQREVDAERFVMPSLQADLEELERTDADVAAAAASYDAMVEQITSADRTPNNIPTEVTHDPRCGQPLTGGGAPRGWVLVRIIGQGQPRRYCSPTCARAALVEAPRPAPAMPSTPRRGRPSRSNVDVDEIVRRYQAGETSPQIGKALGHTAKTIRDALDRAGVQRRDDRANGSGGANRVEAYPDELVARVRALYTLHGRTQREVAEALGIGVKVVYSVMAKHGIEARPAAHIAGSTRPPRAARAADEPLSPGEVVRRRKLSDVARARPPAPYAAAEVRAWCREVGMFCPSRGRFLPAPIVAAYLAAHPNGAQQ